MLKRIISYIQTLSLYPAARTIVTAQSEMQRWKTLGQKPEVHFELPYDGRKIMLLALYQKGELRPDVLRLIKAAREEGLYVLAVNTLKLCGPDKLEGVVDCYIERPNYGRDFGSYKTGFLHLFENGWDRQCPRLLMINDSIFFSEDRMPKFINDLMTSNTEVLGSTENFDIEYHLGSFCIAMGQTILGNSGFQKYWKTYRLSDVRPAVIKRGELKLSKVLKRCVYASNQFSALYSATRFRLSLEEDESLADFALKNVRTSSIFAWKRASLKNVAREYRDRFAMHKLILEDLPRSIEFNTNATLEEYHVENLSDLRTFLEKQLGTDQVSVQNLRSILHAELLESFMSGSQIHQNAVILLKAGLPIIKLDGLYRGIFSYEDVARICKVLNKDEAQELSVNLMSRPYGGRYLTGWRRAAFEAGLL